MTRIGDSHFPSTLCEVRISFEGLLRVSQALLRGAERAGNSEFLVNSQLQMEFCEKSMMHEPSILQVTLYLFS